MYCIEGWVYLSGDLNGSFKSREFGFKQENKASYNLKSANQYPLPYFKFVHYTFLVGTQKEGEMSLHEEYDDQSFSDYNFDDDIDDMNQKKRVKRMLEDRLERKRLRDEFKDDFDELSGEFDWDELDK